MNSLDVRHYEQLYSTKPEEDILELWLRRGSLGEDAANALQRVIQARNIDLVALAAEQSEADYRTIAAAGEKQIASERRGLKIVKVLAAVAALVFIVQLLVSPAPTMISAFSALVKALVAFVVFGIVSAVISFSCSKVKEARQKRG